MGGRAVRGRVGLTRENFLLLGGLGGRVENSLEREGLETVAKTLVELTLELHPADKINIFLFVDIEPC